MEKRTNIRELMFSQFNDKALFEQAKSYAYAYLDEVNDRQVFPTEEAVAKLRVFDEALPEAPQPADELLKLLHEYGSPATVSQIGGRYYGFVNGSATPAALAAKWLADVWDQNPALHVISPLVSQLETTCENWLIDLLGLPAETAAGFVSGTSIATLCGLAAGRYRLYKNLAWDVNAQGLRDAPQLRIVLGEQAHATVLKALALLGFGSDNIEQVPVDAQGRIDVAKMPELDHRTLVIAQAGNVNSGAFDPLEQIGLLANRAGAWLHVDGAFGLWAAASRNKRALAKGLEKADSWSVDAHKTLNAPYDCGVILCRHRAALVSAMQTSGDYIQFSEQRDSMLYTPEMSRRARAVDLWATLKFLGRSGVEELVDGLCERAAQFAERLQAEGFRILNEVVFNQVLCACDSAEQTEATLAKIQQSGECWCGGSFWNGEPVIRLSVCSWATTPADVERSVAAILAARRAS